MSEYNPVKDDYYDEPLLPEGVPLIVTYRLTDHRCGVFSWQGTGRSDCPNRWKG